MRCTILLCLVAVFLGKPLPAAEPTAKRNEPDFSAELPRIAPTEAAEALTTFQVQPGFAVELVAAEPLVNDPVAAAFDEDGRLYVVEMRGYSEQPDDKLSRVRRLEDTDADGRFDQSTVLVDGLSWPTAVVCYGGGVFVADAPDIWYFKDTDGDGQADERRLVFTGFGKINVQGLLNSFAWGLDNRIHGATSTAGGQIRRGDRPDDPPINLNGRDFAFDPRSLALSATSGGAQHGMSFDAWGRKFVCSNSDHIQQVMFEDRYLARNPYLSAPGPRVSIAADGPQAEVYRLSPVEPWRIVRTRLRVSGAAPGPIEGGGRAAGYFTGATGVTLYRGDAWPATELETAVVGDVGGNLVHRKRLEPDGLQFVARRIDPDSEFVASRDIWFRPAQFLNAPDGTLYILDVYREVIEHPASLPPVIKRHLDLTSGRDRGRIYRIVPKGFQARRPPPRLSKSTTKELVALLAHPNGWHRETASRLLYERRDSQAAPLLKRLAAESESPLGRMHAFYALAGLSALDEATLIDRLADEHPGVREHAVKLAEAMLDQPRVAAAVLAMTDDDDLRVRYQLAFTLGQLDSPERLTALARLARRDAGDRWMRLAIQSSLGTGADEVLRQLAGDEKFRQTTTGRAFLEMLARQVGLANRADEVRVVLTVVDELAQDAPSATAAVVRGLAGGASQRGAKLSDVLAADPKSRAKEILVSLLAAARATAANDEKPVAERVEAIALLPLGSFADAEQLAADLLNHRQPQAVQLGTMQVLAKFDDPAIAEMVLAAWPHFSPPLRAAATELMFGRSPWTVALFDAIDRGVVHAADVDPARFKQLASRGDPALRRRAEKLLSSLQLGRRKDVVEQYRDVLAMPGNVERGKAAFKKVCAACHRVGDIGHEIGPNLATVKNRGAEAILVNVLDPNREVNPQFINYVAITDDGRTLTGMITAETATSVTLRRAEGASDTLLRVNIDELQSTGMSLMPEGIEKDFAKQDLADLIEFLLK
ncbi:MAG TPA: PVC-type heme-binding CxxCH protein [Pirellulales bacterium]